MTEIAESPYHNYAVSYVKKNAPIDHNGNYKSDHVVKAGLDLRKSPDWHAKDAHTKEPLRVRKLVRDHPTHRELRSRGYELHSYDHNINTYN